jgi:membrane-bound serine protease (ClpP class)
VDIVVLIAVLAIALLGAELLLPTGGLLAVAGAVGLVAAGMLALGEDAAAADYVGPGLITLGALSLITFFVLTPKILRSQRDEPVRTGWEEMIGAEGEVRLPLDPVGQVFVDGALWRARTDGEAEIGLGSRVRVAAVDGLTLVVQPLSREGETG